MNALQEFAVSCPYCGEAIELVVDCSAGSQTYIEDCQVCCKPMNVVVAVSAEGVATVNVVDENSIV
jgi:hypothetical protein